MDDTNLLVQCDFEVFGHVQGKVDSKLLRIFKEGMDTLLFELWNNFK